MKIIATTLQGLENILADEVKLIGGSNIEILNRAVKYDGSRYTLYASNLLLRTALRILVPIQETKIRNEQHLYNDVYSIEWEKLFKVDHTFAVNATVSSNKFTHSKYIALKTKDAIVDRFRKKLGKRPNVELDDPDFVINIHIRQEILTISMDSSGKSLFKRGYRLKTVPAPLNEVLAAGLLNLSGWDRQMPLYDPMCGSGTILLEAYQWAKGIPPHNASTNFCFKKWRDFDPKIFQLVLDKEMNKLEKYDPLLYGSDISKKAIAATEMNFAELDPNHQVKLFVRDFLLQPPPTETPGILILNPPYDKRLRQADINQFYRQIGDTLKKYYTGWTAFIFSGNVEALKSIGLRATKRYSLKNAAIDTKFYKFDLYEGSKKRS